MILLDEKLVEEAAKNAVQCRFNLKGAIQFGDIYEQGFLAGVFFAEQQLKEKMIEFAEWMKEQPILICQTTNGYQWASSYMGGGYYTSEQLLEQFLNKE